ncbi:MAG: HAD-IA family hydrolase [Bacteroidaceae bacterium]|nr:HAD-IA family hydrolase [Bacteroidaceae bacterium]
MLKAVLFDMDGVLVDSMPGHAKAWVKAAHDVGLSLTEQEVYINEGRTGDGTINILMQREYGRDATADEVKDIYSIKSHYYNLEPEPPVIEGAAEMLRSVQEAGLKCILVTGSGEKAQLDRLEKHFPGVFTREAMVTAFDVHHCKPHPEPYLMGLAKAGVTADEAIVVENAPLGVQAARAAGIYTVAVNTGPLPESALAEAGANTILPSEKAFPEFLNTFIHKQ